MKVAAWVFIVLVAGFDIGFAIHNSSTLNAWELNPVAQWLYERGGIALVGLLKGLTLATASFILFCNGMGWFASPVCNSPFDWTFTLLRRYALAIIVSIHAFWLGWYLFGCLA